MTQAGTYQSLLKKFNNCSSGVQWYFDQVPSLLPNYAYEVTIAYLFFRTERAQNAALYCGAVKIHRCDKDVAWTAISAQHLTRVGFVTLYSNVFGVEMPASTRDIIKRAEKIRDKIIHGKDVEQKYMREAISDVFEYAELMNKDLTAAAGFAPFGPLTGFKGRGTPLDKGTSRWLMKGLGFQLA